MRLLSIGYWHHFAYMAISMALLGFGAAGSVLFILYNRISDHPDVSLLFLAGLTAISFPVAFSLSQKVGLDPLQLIWQKTQWFKMFLTYLLMALPFMLAGGIAGFILTGAGEKIHRMYAIDLSGAGLGALIIVPALYVASPWRLLPILSCIVLFGAIGFCIRMKRPYFEAIILLSACVLLGIVYMIMPPLPKIHESKGLPMTLALPDARIEMEKMGPLGIIHVVGSSQIRYIPGLSLAFGQDSEYGEKDIPKQKAIFVDADGLSPITSFSKDPEKLACLDFTSMALPFHIRDMQKMLIIGAGGGMDILLGILNHVPEIVAIESNRQIADLLINPFADFSGHLYSRPDVRLEVRKARHFLRSTEERYDLIQMSMTDSFVNSAGGLHSAAENYLYTSQAFKQYLKHLTGPGIIAVTRWLKLPPRDSLRILSTALSAIRDISKETRPEKHFMIIRSWKTFTILISRRRFSMDEVSRAKKFCNERSFDMVFYAGMKAEEANRYDVQKIPYYFNGASELCGPNPESFIKDYLFDISLTTDDRPFFSDFLKWEKINYLFRSYGREWFGFVEMGNIFILATLAQASIAGIFLVLVPLLFLKRLEKSSFMGKISPGLSDIIGVIIYFGFIGSGFMFMEMALLPRFTLLLSQPVYAASLVLATILVFAGLGSLIVRRIEIVTKKILWISILILSCWVLVQVLAGDWFFNRILGQPLLYRLAFSVSFIAIPSFFLGWPFPLGFRFIAMKYPNLAPWAWGINGCASVTGAVLGKIIAMSLGFQFLTLTACVVYFFAVLTFHFAFRMGHDRIPLKTLRP